MTEPMTDKEIRKWYDDNGVKYVRQDYGRRDPETGEGLENDGSVWNNWKQWTGTNLNFEQYLTWLEDQGRVGRVWHERPEEEREYIEALEDFFAPYLALLPRPKGNLLVEYMGMRRTQADIAREEGKTQQAVSAALRTALRALIRRIAEDDPDWSPLKDGRARDFEGEWEAAERVFDRWLASRREGGQ